MLAFGGERRGPLVPLRFRGSPGALRLGEALVAAGLLP